MVLDTNGNMLGDGKSEKLESVRGRLGLSLLRIKKREVDDRDPLDWNTDDEEGGYQEQGGDDNEPEWPAKGGYID